MKRVRWSVIGPVAFAVGCARPAPPPPSEARVEVRVLDYADAPVAGTVFRSGSQDIATTSEDGRVTLSLPGREGDILSVEVRCPSEYASPEEPIVIQRLSIVGSVASHLTRCRRLRHRLVVGVRAEGGPNLPITRLGRVVGTTDAAGAATLMFDLDGDQRVELTLSTEALVTQKISPRNPSAVFDVGNGDDVKLFDVRFTRPTVVRPPPAKAVAHRQGPRPM